MRSLSQNLPMEPAAISIRSDVGLSPPSLLLPFPRWRPSSLLEPLPRPDLVGVGADAEESATSVTEADVISGGCEMIGIAVVTVVSARAVGNYQLLVFTEIKYAQGD